jgi:predicted unusual protein kinase regulating ubiquinone biosynthesis (AarF/ABC1/UbiB family)
MTRLADAATSARRLARLGRLPAGAVRDAAEGAVRRARGEDPAAVAAALRRRSADRLRTVLGSAKGGALKAGQLLATVSALFPADPDATWETALAALPSDNPPEPFAVLEPVLEVGLGRGWRAELPELDEQAVAAASIGQVHRGRWHDGRDVAVKIQYPGVAEALRVDLAAVSAMTRASALVAPGMALPPLVAEMRDRLAEELDYTREARVQRAFADAWRDDPRVVVPEVVAASRRVLVATWLEGTTLTALAGAPQDVRDRVAALYVEALLSGPARTGWLHTDPHPGNFLRVGRGDGPVRLGVLDFGSALPMPEGIPATFGRLLRLLRDEPDPAAVLAGLGEEGFVRPGSRVDPVKLRDYLSPFTEPSRHEVFTFTPEWLRGQFGRLGDPRNPDFAVALQLTLPPEHLFTHRVWLGVVGVLCRLRATIRIDEVVTPWMPGLRDA